MNVCMIPCRAGSERLKKKNYTIMHGQNLVERMVIKALASASFDKIYINSDGRKLYFVQNSFSMAPDLIEQAKT